MTAPISAALPFVPSIAPYRLSGEARGRLELFRKSKHLHDQPSAVKNGECRMREIRVLEAPRNQHHGCTEFRLTEDPECVAIWFLCCLRFLYT